MKRLVLGALFVLTVIAAAITYWLFYDNRPPAEGTFPLDIAALREEAATFAGPGPQRIEVEVIYNSVVPKIAMIAGTGWSELNLVRSSYRLLYPKSSVIIDTGSDEDSSRKWDSRLTSYDRAAWSRMQNGLSRASLILVTHEHGDHIGGLLQSPNWRRLLPKALINTEQFRNVTQGTVWPGGSREGFKPFSYRGVKAVAPGVVLIRAPGHTPGSQMIYVRRADGHEYIFMGDTASSIDNVRLIRIRSRYVTDFGGHEDDRSAVFLQTMALNRLSKDVPGLTLVPGHDFAALLAIEKAGLMTRGFTSEP